MKIDCIAFTHRGLLRSNNEDCILCDGWMRNRTMDDPVKFSFTPDSLELRLFAVADGLGGHSSGEVASQFALSKLCSSVTALSALSKDSLAEVIKDLHRSLFNMSAADTAYRGMGATSKHHRYEHCDTDRSMLHLRLPLALTHCCLTT